MTLMRPNLQDPKFCEICSAPYSRRHPSGNLIRRYQWAKQRFCGRPCAVVYTTWHKLSYPYGRRLMARVQVGDPKQCWPWKRITNAAGYGVWSGRGRKVSQLAHRAIYELCYDRQLPPEIVVRHLCHNRLCCNPAHLLEGSMADNNADMVRAGRACWQQR